MEKLYKKDGFKGYGYTDKKDLDIPKPKAPYIEEVLWVERIIKTKNNDDDDDEYEDKFHIEYKITYIDLDVYLFRKGIIFLWEDLTLKGANKIIQKIMLLDITQENKPEKISLFISCSNGSSWGAQSLYYVMKSTEIQIETIGVKEVAGAGIFALIGGNSRLALPNCRFRLYPQVSVSFKCKDFNPEFFNEFQEEHLRWEDLKNIFTLETGNSIEDINIISYMSTTEAKNYGIIDDILGEISINKTESEKVIEERFRDEEWDEESDEESDE